MGRKTTLDTRISDAICRHLKQGKTDKVALARVRPPVASSTFYNWLKRGEKEEAEGETPESSIYVYLLDAVTRARELGADVHETTIYKAGTGKLKAKDFTRRKVTETRFRRDGTSYLYELVEETETERTLAPDWRASLEWLKRRRKADWSERVEHEGRITLESAIDDAAEKFDALLRAKSADGDSAGMAE